MSVPILDVLAQSIYKYEGTEPSNLAFRNCNPGNLRPSSETQEHDTAGYRIFPTFVEGYLALQADLQAKMSGQNAHGLGPWSSLAQLFSVYAPAGDENAPLLYAKFVCDQLLLAYPQLACSVDTPIELICKSIGQEVPGVVVGA